MEFIEALRQAGFLAPKVEPGKLTRFPGIGKKRGDSGWCILFDHQRFGIYGDHSIGLEERWTANKDLPRLYVPKTDNSASKKMAREKAMFVARKVMNSVAKGFNHPYAIRKRIPNGWYRTYKDKIAVPIFSLPDKKLVNIQFISANGTKRFIKGGMIKGCVGLIGDHTQYHVGVAEGFATAVTIMKQYGARCMFVSLFADNIEPAVAGLVKCGYEVNIFADDDRLNPKNPGYNKALEAGKKHKCVLFVPEWPEDAPKELTDFNDLEGWMLDHSGAQEQNSFRA